MLVDRALPFILLGVGLLVAFMVRSAPRERWRSPGHLLKAALFALFTTLVVIVPTSMVLAVVLTLLRR